MRYDNRILHGNALDQLKTLDSETVDCCITSPPYWALRDYKTPGQLGLEPTFQEYITKLVEIINEVKRVLKKEGSCWVNLGDTYANNATAGNKVFGNPEFNKNRPSRELTLTPKKRVDDIPEKSLCLIPQRFAIAMVDAGWICRNTIIWYKPNCMPSSAKDRFTVDFEYLFFFTKSQKYYFETQYEPLDTTVGSGWEKQRQKGIDTNKYNIADGKSWQGTMENGRQPQSFHKPIAPFGGNKAAGYGNPVYSGNEYVASPLGRIKRCVWKIPTQPFNEAHFAVFPPAIVETPLKACCPEYVCRKCGKAREKIVEKEYDFKPNHKLGGKELTYDRNFTRYDDRRLGRASISKVNDLGWNECNCNAGFNGGIVLDPFFGSGTTGLVAIQNARNFIGIELSQAYIDMALKRLEPYLLQTRLV